MQLRELALRATVSLRAMARRSALRTLCAAALARAASGLFSTTLHGGSGEVIPIGTPGATTLTLQEWLTDIDPDVRAARRVKRVQCTAAQQSLTRLAALLLVCARDRRSATVRRGWHAHNTCARGGALMRRSSSPPDGTPAGYYFAPGSDASSWLIYLEGGYWYAFRSRSVSAPRAPV